MFKKLTFQGSDLREVPGLSPCCFSAQDEESEFPQLPQQEHGGDHTGTAASQLVLQLQLRSSLHIGTE